MQQELLLLPPQRGYLVSQSAQLVLVEYLSLDQRRLLVLEGFLGGRKFLLEVGLLVLVRLLQKRKLLLQQQRLLRLLHDLLQLGLMVLGVRQVLLQVKNAVVSELDLVLELVLELLELRDLLLPINNVLLLAG